MAVLTPKQERFVDEYLVDLNATAAATRAGYSERTANEQGARLLANVSVRSAIQLSKARRSERTKIDADWVLRTLAEEKSADLASIYADDGSILPVKDWPMVFRTGLVVGVETVESHDGYGEERKPISIRKIKISDRIKHLELIGRHVDVQAFRDASSPPGLVAVQVNLSGATQEQLRAVASLKLPNAAD